MKNAEGLALPFELDRRLKAAVDRLGEVRETLEELDPLADSLGPLLGVSPRKGRARAASQPSPAAMLPPAKEARTPTSSTPPAPPAPAQEEEVPEWRKRFPGLSAQHPKRSK
jgi:hypothetical protein